MNTENNEEKATWGVTYCGNVLSGIREDTIHIPMPVDHLEVTRLTDLGYSVWTPEHGSYVVIRRP